MANIVNIREIKAGVVSQSKARIGSTWDKALCTGKRTSTERRIEKFSPYWSMTAHTIMVWPEDLFSLLFIFSFHLGFFFQFTYFFFFWITNFQTIASTFFLTKID